MHRNAGLASWRLENSTAQTEAEFRAEERFRAAWNGHSQLPKIPAEKRDELRRQLDRRLGLQKPFSLFVGTLERRKNMNTLVEAFACVASDLDLQCVMVGKAGYGFSEIMDSVERQRCRNRHILAGLVTDEELALLHNLAELLYFLPVMRGLELHSSRQCV